MFTPSQLHAINSTAQNILAIAGPGSGKTTVLIERICRLISAGADPRNMVVITFTNAAAKDMRERIEEALVAVPRFHYMGTLHGYALRMLQEHGGPLGYGKRITILDEEQATELLAEAAKSVGCKMPVDKLRELAATIGDERPKTPPQLAIAHYRRQLRQNSAVDFDTILRDFLKLLHLAEAVRSKWVLVEHLFVDEFQDSAVIDAAIYSWMYTRNRFYVGDPDQAIYGFRGGDVRCILRLADCRGWETILLEVNFRCAVSICNAANRLIRHNQNRVDKATIANTVATGVVSYNERCGLDTDEMGLVLGQIKQELARGTPADEIAVLFRGNAMAFEYAKSAEALGILVRKKNQAKMPADWLRARVAVELLNDPDSTIVGTQWLRMTQGASVARDAVREMHLRQTDTLGIEGLKRGIDAQNVAEGLARLGISRESIELVEAKRATLVNPTLTEISFALARDLETVHELGDGVTFTTMHSAKGREWRVVFLPGCEQELIPGTAKTRNVEEERRLMFVAITRAKDALVITASVGRKATWGNKCYEPATPSQFIMEACVAK